jgi:CelD/BcsL family acetyltransferase involved in cellulose biosynthesis
MHTLDPIADPRWAELVARHPKASVFHSPGWLESLRRTYGYQPVAFSTKGGELINGIVFCEVRSWLTGRRLVSLPFSDHCEPLADAEEFRILEQPARMQAERRRCKYVEYRPISPIAASGLSEQTRYRFHAVDLQPDIEALYRRLHESCIRRKIKKAEKERLCHKSGRSELLFSHFWKLLLLTRRRHKLPPQPAEWFRNLAAILGEQFSIHVAYLEDRPIASIVTLSFKNTIVYKYGCSDAAVNSLGATPFLFWQIIQHAKRDGMTTLDLGRSDIDDVGLSTFKEHLGGAPSDLTYYRTKVTSPNRASSLGPKRWIREGIARLPDPVLTGLGSVLYRHLG